MGLTKAQSAAINERGKSVLVSAAAGSGKTYTLTKRIIDKIIGDENNPPRDISRMLIVTFTRSAAQDLREKIFKALTKAIEKHPDKPHLKEQLLHLGDAKISTIDSFFIDPVKENFDKLGLPANLRLADSTELGEVKKDCLTSAIEEMYSKSNIVSGSTLCDINLRNDFLDLWNGLSSTKQVSKINEYLIDIHKNVMTTPDGVEALKKNAEKLRKYAGGDFFACPFGEAIQSKAIATALLAESKFDYYIELIKSKPEEDLVLEKYLPKFEEYKTACTTLAQKCRGTYAEAKEAYESFKLSALNGIGNNDKTPFAEECGKIKTAINGTITTKDGLGKKVLFRTPDEIKEQLLLTARYNEIIYEIIYSFNKKYTAYKEEHGLFEFYDMPIYLLRLLKDESISIINDMRAKYDEVYIDEYQDVNTIQDEIFKLIGGERKRFMVGDIKQSIYGFRDAVPELFSGYRDSFPKHGDPAGEDSDGCTIFMSENFRCDRNVIDFSNTVCAFLFEAAGKRLNYQKEDDLKFGKINIPDGYVPPKVQVNIVEDYSEKPKKKKGDPTDEEQDTSEAVIISAAEEEIPREIILCAKEIARLIKEEVKLNPDYDPDNPDSKEPPYKKISAKDIAILVAKKKHAPLFAKALKKYGVSYHMSAISQLFDGEDMKALLFLLKVINNPLDDVALSGFLTSSAYSGSPMFTLAELITIRRHEKDTKTLFAAVRQYGKHGENDPLDTLLSRRARAVVKLIGELRAYSRKVSVEKLLKYISANEEFSLVCETDAYVYLYDTACNYTKNSWNGLYSFLKVFKKLAENGDASFKDAAPADAVNIMTIHQSKGLERHAIFLYKVDENFPNMEANDRLNYKAGLGCAMKLPTEAVDENGNSVIEKYESSIVRDALLESIRQDKILEEMRVLYVALTRARERLYISATIKGSFEDYKNNIRMNGMSSYAKTAYNNFLSWITMALIDPVNTINHDSFVINTVNAADINPNVNDYLSDVLQSESELSKEEKKYVEIIKKNRKRSEDSKDVTIPSKIAASKANDTLFDYVSDESGLDDETRKEGLKKKLELLRSSSKNLFKPTDKTASAADIGTATHAFLQFCDFVNLRDYGVEKEIERLVENEFMTAEDASLINRTQIDKFVKSDLFELILSTKNVHREFRFGLFVDAQNFAQSDEAKTKLAGKRIYVQGSIDILIEADNDEIYICDYKTDRVNYREGETANEFRSRLTESYSYQLAQYKNAVKQIFGRDPDRIFIYSLSIGQTVEIKI